MISIILSVILLSHLPLPEELKFDIKYGPFTAGELILRIEQIDTLFKITCIEKTTGFFSSIYKLNDNYEIWTDSNFMPLIYEDWKEEGSYKRHRKIEYYHDERLAVYNDKYNLELHDDARELFSLIYYIRTLNISSGDTLRFWLHQDKKNLEIIIPVKDKTIDDKTYLEVTPDVGDIKFFGGKGLKIYYDANMIPERFNFGFWLGSISAVKKNLE